MRILRQARGKASGSLPSLPRGGLRSKNKGRPSSSKEAPAKPRDPVHAAGPCDSLRCRAGWHNESSFYDPSRRKQLPLADAVPGRPGLGALRIPFARDFLSSRIAKYSPGWQSSPRSSNLDGEGCLTGVEFTHAKKRRCGDVIGGPAALGSLLRPGLRCLLFVPADSCSVPIGRGQFSSSSTARLHACGYGHGRSRRCRSIRSSERYAANAFAVTLPA
jgi:hypothetical protein